MADAAPEGPGSCRLAADWTLPLTWFVLWKGVGSTPLVHSKSLELLPHILSVGSCPRVPLCLSS